MDEFPVEGFTPRLIDAYWIKGVANVVCQKQETPGLATDQSTGDEGMEGLHTQNGRPRGPRHLQNHGGLVSEPSRRQEMLTSVSL